jgi:hypothetical protein
MIGFTPNLSANVPLKKPKQAADHIMIDSLSFNSALEIVSPFAFLRFSKSKSSKTVGPPKVIPLTTIISKKEITRITQR